LRQSQEEGIVINLVSFAYYFDCDVIKFTDDCSKKKKNLVQEALHHFESGLELDLSVAYSIE
jgi:hypothetical protein